MQRTGYVKGPHGLGCCSLLSNLFKLHLPAPQCDVTYRFAPETSFREEAFWRVLEGQWIDLRLRWGMGGDAVELRPCGLQNFDFLGVGTRKDRPYLGTTMASPLEGCVASLRNSMQLLDSSINILDDGVSDLPRLAKVLQTTRHFELISESDLQTAQAALLSEIRPEVDNLLKRVENYLDKLERREQSLVAKCDLNDGRLGRDGTGMSGSRPASRSAPRGGGKAVSAQQELRVKALKAKKDRLSYAVETLELQAKQRQRQLRMREFSLVRYHNKNPSYILTCWMHTVHGDLVLGISWHSPKPSPMSPKTLSNFGFHTTNTTSSIMSSLRIARAALRARPAAIARPIQRRGYAEVANDKIKLSLALPHQSIYKSQDVVQVNLPAETGDMGVLANHVASIEQLKPGLVEIIEESGGSKQFFLSGGFAVVQPNSVLSINAVEGYPLEDFSAEAVRNQIGEAQKIANGSGSEADIAEAKIELESYMTPGFNKPTSSSAARTDDTAPREQTRQLPSARKRQGRSEAHAPTPSYEQPKQPRSISSEPTTNSPPPLTNLHHSSEIQSSSHVGHGNLTNTSQNKHPYVPVVDRVGPPCQEPRATASLGRAPSPVDARIEGHPLTASAFESKNQSSIQGLTSQPRDQSRHSQTAVPSLRQPKLVSVRSVKNFFENKASQHPSAPLLPPSATATRPNSASPTRYSSASSPRSSTRDSSSAILHVTKRQSSTGENETSDTADQNASYRVEHSTSSTGSLLRSWTESEAAEAMQSVVPQANVEVDKSVLEVIIRKPTPTVEPKLHDVQGPSENLLRRLSMCRSMSAIETTQTQTTSRCRQSQLESQRSRSYRDIRTAFEEHRKYASERTKESRSRHLTDSCGTSDDAADRPIRKRSSQTSSPNFEIYRDRFGKHVDVRKRPGVNISNYLSYDGSHSPHLSGRDTASSPIPNLDMGIGNLFQNHEAPDYIDNRQGYGRRITQDFGFPGAHTRSRDATRSSRPVQDPGTWVKRACGHFSYMGNTEHREHAQKRTCRQCSARTGQPKQQPLYRQWPGRRITTSPSTSTSSSKIPRKADDRNTRPCQQHTKRIPTDRCGDIFAEDLGQIIDFILKDHANTLQDVIDNIQHSQPSLDKLQKVSGELVQRCRTASCCVYPGSLSCQSSYEHQKVHEASEDVSDSKSAQQQVFLHSLPREAEKLNIGSPGKVGPNINDKHANLLTSIKSVPDLVDLVKSAADDLGVDLESRPSAEDEDMFLNAPCESTPCCSASTSSDEFLDTIDETNIKDEPYNEDMFLNAPCENAVTEDALMIIHKDIDEGRSYDTFTTTSSQSGTTSLVTEDIYEFKDISSEEIGVWLQVARSELSTVIDSASTESSTLSRLDIQSEFRREERSGYLQQQLHEEQSTAREPERIASPLVHHFTIYGLPKESFPLPAKKRIPLPVNLTSTESEVELLASPDMPDDNFSKETKIEEPACYKVLPGPEESSFFSEKGLRTHLLIERIGRLHGVPIIEHGRGLGKCSSASSESSCCVEDVGKHQPLIPKETISEEEPKRTSKTGLSFISESSVLPKSQRGAEGFPSVLSKVKTSRMKALPKFNRNVPRVHSRPRKQDHRRNSAVAGVVAPPPETFQNDMELAILSTAPVEKPMNLANSPLEQHYPPASSYPQQEIPACTKSDTQIPLPKLRSLTKTRKRRWFRWGPKSKEQSCPLKILVPQLQPRVFAFPQLLSLKTSAMTEDPALLLSERMSIYQDNSSFTLSKICIAMHSIQFSKAAETRRVPSPQFFTETTTSIHGYTPQFAEIQHRQRRTATQRPEPHQCGRYVHKEDLELMRNVTGLFAKEAHRSPPSPAYRDADEQKTATVCLKRLFQRAENMTRIHKQKCDHRHIMLRVH
ncbi:ATP synthase delta chain mitochondrial precursor [Pyrenophora seminiperda CCB06]|uniref:ATP synthase subunit delta, mitochondrial n=1 Tax=Pyrenophora seminiperda CCB06 TaxID=1302712 RepID=A0A3M7MCH2_9PLEO|nr:ATP synthase delta chain mitochondrial precursor [Pyrenophora seminiperda CCB06]